MIETRILAHISHVYCPKFFNIEMIEFRSLFKSLQLKLINFSQIHLNRSIYLACVIQSIQDTA